MIRVDEDEVLEQILAGVDDNDEDIRDELDRFADEVCDYAKQIAPVLARPHIGRIAGAFRDSIHVEKMPDVLGAPARSIVSDVWYARFEEFGTVNEPRIATFGQTAVHFGGDMNDETRGQQGAAAGRISV